MSCHRAALTLIRVCTMIPTWAEKQKELDTEGWVKERLKGKSDGKEKTPIWNRFMASSATKAETGRVSFVTSPWNRQESQAYNSCKLAAFASCPKPSAWSSQTFCELITPPCFISWPFTQFPSGHTLYCSTFPTLMFRETICPAI